jgi:hypothetical protein
MGRPKGISKCASMAAAMKADLLRRAHAAYFRRSARAGSELQEVAGALCGVRPLNGRVYVILRNGSGIVAVYRATSDCGLRRLRRWPTELNA